MTGKHERVVALSNGTYDVLKQIAQYWLPAAGTLYFALAGIWGLPYAEQIIGTITAVDIFLGVVLGISAQSYKKSDAAYDGHFVVDTTDPETDKYSLVVDVPFEDLQNKDALNLKIKDASQ